MPRPYYTPVVNIAVAPFGPSGGTVNVTFPPINEDGDVILAFTTCRGNVSFPPGWSHLYHIPDDFWTDALDVWSYQAHGSDVGSNVGIAFGSDPLTGNTGWVDIVWLLIPQSSGVMPDWPFTAFQGAYPNSYGTITIPSWSPPNTKTNLEYLVVCGNLMGNLTTSFDEDPTTHQGDWQCGSFTGMQGKGRLGPAGGPFPAQWFINPSGYGVAAVVFSLPYHLGGGPYIGGIRILG